MKNLIFTIILSGIMFGYAQEKKDTTQEEVFDYSGVEVQPEFPNGGMAGFTKFLENNYRYPAMVGRQEISGKVIVAYIVEKDGSLSDIKVLRDLGFGTGEEAIRLLKSSPKWKPGIQNGKPVRVAYVWVIVLDSTKKQKSK